MHSTGQCNRNEPGPLLYPTYKTYNRLKDVNVRLETIQLLEDNRCSKLPDITNWPTIKNPPMFLISFRMKSKFLPWRRKWQSTPALLPGKSHGQKSLVGYSPWRRKESDTIERLHFVQFSQHHLLKRLFFFFVCSWLLCHQLFDHIWIGLFLGSLFFSVDLYIWFYANTILFGGGAPFFNAIFKSYFPFTVTTKYQLYSLCCTIHP